ncbi:hypothetical protein; putative membrane protein [Xenorhabdus bovienii str. puntauvense]|uniref:O-antigen polymerase n=1 Tax=Xenorhabdus bovienii str. puntauvense TaxID=1398201 RepID=A0A077NK30_XENBV|nr:hypothetical protein [Xenorhabdus bovienii]CDG98908.1 hypothetical protein; putative membrane protein [Xenorhabdus bovienii str. puntauvense]
MIIFKLLEKRSIYIFISLAYKFLLDIAYINFVSPLYKYTGFHKNLDISQYLIGWILFFLLLYLSPHNIKKTSDYFISQAIFSLLTPLIVLYGMDFNLTIEPIFYSILSILFIKSLICLPIKPPKIPIIKNGEYIFYITSFFMVLYLVFWYVLSGAVKNINFDPRKVYDFREINSNLTDISILAYINEWVYNVFSLSLLGYALWKKKYILFTFVFICQIFFYSISAHKSVLFTPLFVIGIYCYFRHTRALSTIPLFFSSTIIIGLILYNTIGEITFPSMFIRRVFFVPAQLTYIYFDFFNQNDYEMWGNSILKSIRPSIYAEGVPKAIGVYIGNDIYANNGYISSGFAQAGAVGILLYSLILGIYLKWLDIWSNKVPELWLSIILVITPLRSLLISSDLFTVMLTHGLIVATFMLILLRKK